MARWSLQFLWLLPCRASAHLISEQVKDIYSEPRGVGQALPKFNYKRCAAEYVAKLLKSKGSFTTKGAVLRQASKELDARLRVEA